MQIRPYCNHEYKKITSNHLKTHDIEYITYLKEYKPKEFYLKFIAQKLMDLYMLDTGKYIEQRYDTNTSTFSWCTIIGAFNKGYIERHLKREITVGVFAYDKLTYF